MTRASPKNEFWRGKRVLVTGHTGFKGGWLTLWLSRMGAEVTGLSLPSTTTPCLFEAARIGTHCLSYEIDIRDAQAVETLVRTQRPEILFHLAAQPLVLASYDDPLETFSTNVMGTANILNALRFADHARVVVAITTDKVYANKEWPFPYREDDQLGGYDPYSASKAACELIISSYRNAFLAKNGIALASARAGNVIGGGDWSENRLVPDAIRAWQSDTVLEIRRPGATRPWQHVLEPISGYLVLAESLWSEPNLAGAYNFGPHTHEAATVRFVIDSALRSWNKLGNREPRVHFGDGAEGLHEAGWLAVEIAKARDLLGYMPRFSLETSILRTINWYRSYLNGEDAFDLCENDFEDFESFV